jgi:hypothetical protein
MGTGNVALKVKNTLFGPTMKTENSEGGDIYPNEAGTVGSVFLSGTLDNLDVENSYKTDFTWIDLNTTGEGDPKIYPLEGLADLPLSESTLWSNPSQGIFTIIGKASGVDFTKLGDARWK